MNAPPEPKRSKPLALLVAMRPRQWFKNLWVLAAVVVTGGLRDPIKTRDTLVTFACFCAISSAIYLLNDWLDVESDRKHPVKRRRPLAAGDLQGGEALVAAAVLAIGGILGAFGIIGRSGGFWSVGWVLVGYLVLQLAYNFVLKRMIIVDVMAIAGGFVLRVLAGGAAINAVLRVRDVARIERAREDTTLLTQTDGEPGISTPSA